VRVNYPKGSDKAQAEAKLEALRSPGEDFAKRIMDRGLPSAAKIKVLAPLEGTWDYTVALREGPGAEPHMSTGTVTNELVFDHRFLSSRFFGTLYPGGHEVLLAGQGLIGYDNTKQVYTSTWADTVTTGMMAGSGKFDEKERVLHETGRFTNPITGVEQGFRSELRFVDANSYRRTVFVLDKSGKESPLMEFEYTRRN
jgi:hypothetical protein